jgi:hypothetical protein
MPNANKGMVVPPFNSIGVFAIVDLNEAYRRIELPLAALWAAISGLGDVTFERSGKSVVLQRVCVWRKQVEPVEPGCTPN